MGQATEFIDYLLKKSQTIPEKVYEKATDCLMDCLAVTCAGAHENRGRWKSYLEHIPAGNARIYGCDVSCDNLVHINTGRTHEDTDLLKSVRLTCSSGDE